MRSPANLLGFQNDFADRSYVVVDGPYLRAGNGRTGTGQSRTSESRGQSEPTSVRNRGSRYIPSTGRNFTIIKGGGASGVDVGCANSDLQALLGGYFSVDFKSIMGYLQSNAGAFLLTWLIYSNPTLYSLLQDLKQAGEFALNANALNCSTIRKIADNSRTKAITKEALDECSNLPPSVRDAQMPQCIEKAVAIRKKRMETKQPGAGATSVNNYLLDNMELSDETRQLIGAMVPDESYSGKEATKTSPTATVTNQYTKAYDEQRKSCRLCLRRP